MAGAHTWAAACAGAAACAAVRIGRRGPTPALSAVLALALCGGVLVRSEGVLFAGALLLAVALVRWRRSGLGPAISAGRGAGPRRRGRAVARTALGGADRRSGAPSDLVARVGPDGSGGTVGGTYLLDRLQGIWHSTFEGTAAGPLTVRLLLPVALALVVAAVVRGRTDRAAPELAVGGLAALAVLVWVVHPTALVRGFLPAAPVVVLGVVVALAAVGGATDEPLLLGTAALFTLAVYATQYADGGNFQWGGRFLTPLSSRSRSSPPGAAAARRRPRRTAAAAAWSARWSRWRCSCPCAVSPRSARVGSSSQSSTRRSPRRRRR